MRLCGVRRRAVRRGFTLVEGAVVFAVMAVLSAVVLLRISGSADPRNDAAAKASLQVFQTIQLAELRGGGAPLDAAGIMSAPDTDRGVVSFVSGASSGVSEVGVLTTASAVTGVARSGDDCWMLRLDFGPSASSPPSWWFLVEGVEVCEAAAFGVLVFPADGSGQSPNAPTILD